MTAVLSRGHVLQFRSLIERRFGLLYEDAKLEYLAEVARQHMDLLGAAQFELYENVLRDPSDGPVEYRALAEDLTVNETFFLRNTDNFRALAEHVLPLRIRARCRDKRLRILSAGCASGEEAYSLAVVVRESLPDLAAWDVQIVGIDVSPAMIARARAGRCSAWSLRATPEGARQAYFRAVGRDFVIDPSILKMVAFEERNLMDEDRAFWGQQYDVVFCRNVLMYFTQERQREVVKRINTALVPGGFLFLGHAENLRGLTQDFHLTHTHDTFYYQRHDATVTTAVVPATQPTTPRDPLPATAQPEDPTASWTAVIQRASARIASLAGRFQSAPLSVDAPPHAPGRELVPILEAVRNERLSEALELVRALPAESHEDPRVLLVHAALLTNTGKLAESEEVCGRLLAQDELNAGAHYLVALCREHAGDLVGAKEHGLAAIYLDAGFAMPHLHLGIMARHTGDFALAQDELRQAQSLLDQEDETRLVLFGGGFSRGALMRLCETELRAVGGTA